jgi:hypothetical protein
MKKFLTIGISIIVFSIIAYFVFAFYATYSEGSRSGELIKFSNKGYVFKTWEGELSQGISGAQIFEFSVLDQDKDIIESMKNLQGNYVKITYIERYKTFPFWGDTRYFVTAVSKEESPFKVK